MRQFFPCSKGQQGTESPRETERVKDNFFPLYALGVRDADVPAFRLVLA